MLSASLLRTVPILVGLPDELLERLVVQIEEAEVRVGSWLMREGDEADSLFIVRSGRLEVVDEGPPETVIRVLRRGDVVGELALLREGTRSASVRAQRDSSVLKLSRNSVGELIQKAPGFALGLTRAIGEHLAASRSHAAGAGPSRTITVIALDPGVSAAEAARPLADALSEHGAVASLTAGDLATIDRAERESDWVVLEGGAAPDDEWAGLCLREADLVVAVTSGKPLAAWLRRTRPLQGCELLVFGDALPAGVLELLQPRSVQVVAEPARRTQVLQAAARRLSGRSLGIVLSGGGARALAHVGVLEELLASGLRIDRIAGVSFGSLVAAVAATGCPAEMIYETFERGLASNPARDFVPPAFSLMRGARTRRLLSQAFGERLIEELPLRFFCLSCDLIGREAVIHRTGTVAGAVYASLAIPGVFPPVATPDGRLLVDGGVLDNLPVATMARAREGPVIAVDVTGQIGQFKRTRRHAVARWGRPVRRALTGSEAEIPRLGETIMRTMTVGSIDTTAAARSHSDLIISPRVEGIGLTEWKVLGRMRERGRQAVREALAAEPDLCHRLGIQ